MLPRLASKRMGWLIRWGWVRCGEEEIGRDWIGLLVVGVEGGIVHEPLPAAFAVVEVSGGAVVSEVDVEIDLMVLIRNSRKWKQWHGHGEIILEDCLCVSFAIMIVSPRSDLRCGSHCRHNTPRLMSVSCWCLLPRSRSRLMHGAGNESGLH